VALNFLLLRTSCDCPDSKSKKNKKKIKVNTPKIFTQNKTESNPVFADK
jgi:hypothetical protein